MHFGAGKERERIGNLLTRTHATAASSPKRFSLALLAHRIEWFEEALSACSREP
jgi:hypothetical protein